MLIDKKIFIITLLVLCSISLSSTSWAGRGTLATDDYEPAGAPRLTFTDDDISDLGGSSFESSVTRTGTDVAGPGAGSGSSTTIQDNLAGIEAARAAAVPNERTIGATTTAPGTGGQTTPSAAAGNTPGAAVSSQNRTGSTTAAATPQQPACTVDRAGGDIMCIRQASTGGGVGIFGSTGAFSDTFLSGTIVGDVIGSVAGVAGSVVGGLGGVVGGLGTSIDEAFGGDTLLGDFLGGGAAGLTAIGDVLQGNTGWSEALGTAFEDSWLEPAFDILPDLSSFTEGGLVAGLEDTALGRGMNSLWAAVPETEELGLIDALSPNEDGYVSAFDVAYDRGLSGLDAVEFALGNSRDPYGTYEPGSGTIFNSGGASNSSRPSWLESIGLSIPTFNPDAPSPNGLPNIFSLDPSSLDSYDVVTTDGTRMTMTQPRTIAAAVEQDRARYYAERYQETGDTSARDEARRYLDRARSILDGA